MLLKNSRFYLVIGFFLATFCGPLSAENGEVAQGEFVNELTGSNPRDVVADFLDLTEEEAEDFWPIYEAYQDEVDEYYAEVVEVIIKYASVYPDVGEASADKMLKKWIRLKQRKSSITILYVGKVSQVLPSTKTLRFLQIENKIEAMVQRELSARIPLVPES